MDDKNLTPQEQNTTEDELLAWVPPELVERAHATAEKDAGRKPDGSGKMGRQRVNYAQPPAGSRRGLSLAALAGGILFLLSGTVFSAVSINSVQKTGPLAFALWMAGQVLSLCIYLLCLIPLGKKPRRALLMAAIGANLASGIAALMASSEHKAGSIALSIFFGLFLSPNTWLLVGLLRRRTAEKLAVLMGGIFLGISFLGLVGTLASGKAATPVHVTAINLAQGLCWLALLATWPVLDRAVLEKSAQPEEDSET